MEDDRFQRLLAMWQALPGKKEDESDQTRNDLSQFDAKLDALCALYLEASAGDQETLAGFFTRKAGTAAEQLAAQARTDILLSYIRRVARRIKSSKDGGLARWGLVAALLACEGSDELDILMACAFLQHAARQAGIDLGPLIEAMMAETRPQAQRILAALRKSDDATITRIIRYHEGTG